MSTRWLSHVLSCAAAAIVLALMAPVFGAVILVTNDYPTIQAAVDAAGSNDTIQIQAGTYREFLNIAAPVRIVGSGSTNCIVHHTNDVLVTITSAGNVELAGIEITGGEVAFGGGFSPTVPRGILASNVTLTLNDVVVNMTRNYAVTVIDGSLFATNVALYTRNVLQQWDVGFQLKGCFARIHQLIQTNGQIDHTININDPPANFSDVRVENSTIQASHLGYGECVRTYSSSSVVITNCDLYRAPGGQPVSIGNQAIGVNGFSNTVVIVNNLIDSVPTGIRVFGSLPNSNVIKIEYNDIINCASNGVLEFSMSYEGIDLGGGVAQSRGQNFFSNPGARADVELISSSGNMHALSNCWTAANPDDSIIDQLDTNSLGRVTSTPTYCAPILVDCSLVPAFITNVVGFADTVLATVTTNGGPAAGVSVAFSVISGPNAGQGTNTTTDTGGQISFLYTGNGGIGTDSIRAIATVGSDSSTCTAIKVWVGIPPQITCPSDIVTNTAPGTCMRIVTYIVSTNGIPAPAVTLNPPSGTSFSKGVTGVTATASNTYGTAQCSFSVTVNDDERPSVACAGDVTTNIPFGQSQANIAFGAPTASDNCGIATTNCSPASGSTFVLGTNAVTCTAVDTSGNTNNCAFNVIVLGLPNQPPVAQCSNVTVNADANCQATVSAVAVDAGSSDSDGTITNRSLTPAGPFSKGTNTVTLTVFDDGGASNTCNAQIIVVDTTPPAIGPCADIVTNVAAGVTNAVVNFSAPATSDNCGVAGVISVPASGSAFSIGTNTVVSTVTDTSGNTNTCSFSVIVRQTSPDDLAILSVAPPKKISLSGTTPSQTKGVKVAIQNIGPQTVTIDTIGKLTNLVALAIESLGACPVPVAQIVPPKKGFPLVLAPRKKLTVIYNVTFDCANDDAQGAGHEDFRYTVTLNHSALDGKADANTANDNCPRNPNGSDKGCGGKNPLTKQLGADILTDVVEKP